MEAIITVFMTRVGSGSHWSVYDTSSQIVKHSVLSSLYSNDLTFSKRSSLANEPTLNFELGSGHGGKNVSFSSFLGISVFVFS